MRKLLATLLLLLPLAAAAQRPECYDAVSDHHDYDCSQFTQAEYAQLETQLRALNYAQIVLSNVQSMRNYDLQATLNFMDTMTNAIRSHVTGLTWLLDWNGQGNSGGRDFLRRGNTGVYCPSCPQVRMDVVAKALATIKPDLYDNAWTQLMQLKLAYPTVFPKSAETNCKKAVDAVKLLDRSLAYTEPRIRWNTQFQVYDRERSSWVGPHGDYRRYGENMHEALNKLLDLIKADTDLIRDYPEVFPELGAKPSFFYLNGMLQQLVATFGLAVGFEFPNDEADIDTQVDNDTTSRGRQFFRGIMAWEILTNFDHLPPLEGDSFGRPGTTQGLPYKFNNAANHYLTLYNEFEDADIRLRIAKQLHGLIVLWAGTDNAAYKIGHFKWNKAIPFGPDLDHGQAPPEAPPPECDPEVEECPPPPPEAALPMDKAIEELFDEAA